MAGHRRFRWQQRVGGDLLAEFMGTLVLISFGCGVVAMTVAALPQSGRGDVGFQSAGDWILIALGWGLAVTLGIYVAGGVTGAHLNPAVTIARAMYRGFEWGKVAPFILAQMLGAFAGAALVYVVYRDAIHAMETAMKFDRGSPDSAASFGIFATAPAPYFSSVVGPLITEVVGTAFLVATIFAVIDEANTPVRGNLAPIVVGAIVVAIGLSFGANTGYAINPARDFGPRIFAWIAGWGSVAMPGKTDATGAYFFVPIVGPIVGGIIGGAAYDLGIRSVLFSRGATEESADVEEQGETAVEETS